jgi:DNA-directed RNA polymerase specialized sigma subunit
MSNAKMIRKLVKEMEAESLLLDDLRKGAKTEAGRMTEFGRDLIALFKEHDLQQAYVAKLLAISPGAVSQHYNK